MCCLSFCLLLKRLVCSTEQNSRLAAEADVKKSLIARTDNNNNFNLLFTCEAVEELGEYWLLFWLAQQIEEQIRIKERFLLF